MPACAAFESSQRSLVKAFLACLRHLGGVHGTDGEPDLTGIVFCFDRGFHSEKLYNFIVKHGGEVHGTQEAKQGLHSLDLCRQKDASEAFRSAGGYQG